MTEWEKAQAGLLYNPNHDEQLQRSMLACKDLCWELNSLRPSQTAQREALLRKLLGEVGEECTILSPFWCDYGSNIRMGSGCFANHGLVILDAAPVTFGDRVFIAPNCCFTTSGHAMDAPRRGAGLEYAYPITVGSDVWFGASVTVLPGVTIGDGCVIGAGSVVNRDIPANMVAAGVPCRPIRPITPEDGQRTHF